jgi:hypothetical protein
MNYKKHYDQLIRRATVRTIQSGYEVHHINPKCLGGGNESENLVRLTPREHYVAHQLLVKIFPNELNLYRALKIMSGSSRCSNRLYAWIRKGVIENANKLNKPQRKMMVEKRNSGLSFFNLRQWVLEEFNIEITHGGLVNLYRREIDTGEYSCSNLPTKQERNRKASPRKEASSQQQNKLSLTQRIELISRKNNGESYRVIHQWLSNIGIEISYSSLPRIFQREVKLLGLKNTSPIRGSTKRELFHQLKEDIHQLKVKNNTFKTIANILSEKYNKEITWKLCYRIHTGKN